MLFPTFHLCHGWGTEPLSGPRSLIHLERGINDCHKGTGTWNNACMQHSNMGAQLYSRGEAFPPFIWLYPSDSS
jgi:hypothetical protein